MASPRRRGGRLAAVLLLLLLALVATSPRGVAAEDARRRHQHHAYESTAAHCAAAGIEEECAAADAYGDAAAALAAHAAAMAAAETTTTTTIGDAEAADAASSSSAPTPRAARVGPVARRLVALPDLHGDLDLARRSLILARVINTTSIEETSVDDDAWSGGETILVQTGDVLDRGDASVALMRLLDKLARAAKDAGGEVVGLLGNHELMTLQGDLRYVSKRELVKLGKAALERRAQQTGSAGARDGDAATQTEEGRRRWRDLFRAGADLGETLRFDRSMLHVAGEGRCRSLFSHAGIRAHHLAAHRDIVEGVNGALRAASAGDGGDAKFRRHAWRHLFGGDGPLWNRFWSTPRESAEEERAVCDELGAVLAKVGARRMVIGHTIQERGMATRCGGGLHLIDVGVSGKYLGRPAAWACEEGVVTATYEDRVEVLDDGVEEEEEGSSE